MGDLSGAKTYRHGRSGLLGVSTEELADAFMAESARWFLWIPVLFAAGIGLYFSLQNEPSILIAVSGATAAAGLVLLSRRHPGFRALSLAALCAALGFADAKVRTVSLATPMLGATTGSLTVTGRVERIEPRLPKGYRITLRVFSINGLREKPAPRKVRITSRFEPGPYAGSAVRLRAILRPVPEPVMPGGFDFARKAWFAGIGAVGFSLTPAEPLIAAPDPDILMRIRGAVQRLRQSVDIRIREAVPGETGALASALITGERGRITEPTLQALRHSGLAHVLAISGLHMALMAGALYWLARAGMATIPALALRAPIKKIAAVLALAGGGFYLALSGAGIATQRAFLMMAILFLAILLDRPAMTLRNVALAAIIVLALFPESLFDVSFQMSFAAAAALVAVYERWSARARTPAIHTVASRTSRNIAHYFIGIALTTLVAGLAVAPFAAYHFHKLAQYSLIANLATMPIFGLAVMPMALIALLAMPFGLEQWPLQAMAAGIGAITAIAREVSGWEGAVVRVAAIPAFSLLALVTGGLWLILWRERWRFAGLLFAAIGLAAAGGQPRPDMLVGRDGMLVAVRGPGERLAAQAGRTGHYSLERWLAADGDGRSVNAVRGASAFSCDAAACVAEVRGKRIATVHHPSALTEECNRADIVVAAFPLRGHCKAARVTLDRLDMLRGGAHALYLEGQSIRLETVAEKRGHRPWTLERRATLFKARDGRGTARAAGKEKGRQ